MNLIQLFGNCYVWTFFYKKHVFSCNVTTFPSHIGEWMFPSGQTVLSLLAHFSQSSSQLLCFDFDCSRIMHNQTKAVRYSQHWTTLLFLYRCRYKVSQEERTKLREGVPYVKLYRYNSKHLYPKLNGYGDNDQRKVWTSCISAFYTPTVYREPPRPVGHVTACRTHVG